jgi:hypothetical protein
MFVCRRNSTICVVVLMGAVLATLAPGADIAVSGFNDDAVMEVGGTHFAHRFDGVVSAWAEDGYLDPAGDPPAQGLPSSRQFTSATGSGIVYHLQPYDSNNVLRLGDNDPLSGTLTVAPGRYASVHVLTASGAGLNGGLAYPDPNVGVTLNFADGSVPLAGGILTHDWTPSNTFAPGAIPPIALSVPNRVYFMSAASGTSAQLDSRPGVDFAMYESAIDLVNLGLDGRTLQSVTFQHPAGAPTGTIGVFAVDGTPVPEPALAGGIALSLLVLRRRAGPGGSAAGRKMRD